MRDEDSKRTGGRLLCLRVRIFGRPSALVNIHMPCGVPDALVRQKDSGKEKESCKEEESCMEKESCKEKENGKSLLKLIREDFYRAVARRLKILKEDEGRHIILGGDFNSAHSIDILPGPSSGSDARTRVHKALNSVLKPFKLCDVWREAHPDSRTFTFSSKSSLRGSGARLDRFYVSAELTQRIAALHPLLGFPGDHLAVGLRLLRPHADAQESSVCWGSYAMQKFLCFIFEALQQEHHSPSELRAASMAMQVCIACPEVRKNWEDFHRIHERYQQQWQALKLSQSSSRV